VRGRRRPFTDGISTEAEKDFNLKLLLEIARASTRDNHESRSNLIDASHELSYKDL
jgi:hypothetical protein